MYFYTSVLNHKADILLRGYRDGKRVQKRINYKPYLFITSQKPSEYKTLDGRFVERMVFPNTWEAREFQRRYENVAGFDVYGMTNWVYPFINDEFNGKIASDFRQIRIAYLDIETWAEGEFELPTSARKPVTAITLRFRGKNLVFGWVGDYTPPDADTKYFKCVDEEAMLAKFIDVWQRLDFDVVTGWNVEGYDIPYLINRITLLMGIKAANELSPWGFLDRKKVVVRGQETEIHIPAGIAVLDYLEMYKKYRYKPQESYTLEFICQEELGVGKLDYSEYAGLHDLMQQNHQKYIEYNIIDTKRVNDLDDKLKYFNLLFTVAYTAHINFNDAFATTRPWDAIIHSYLMKRKIVVPLMNPMGYSDSIVGGFVKDPHIGLHGWGASFDVTSLYPHLIMMFNISPETLLTVLPGYNPEKVLEGAFKDEKLQAKLRAEGACIAASGAVFDTANVGFYAALMKEFFELRAEYNSLKKKYDAAKEAEKDPVAKAELENLYQEYDANQNALKILLNGAYGALANAYYRWFDPRLAEAITMSGQTAIQWVERALNAKLAELTGNPIDYVIAIDTDSNYINLQPIVDALFSGLSPKETCLKLHEFCESALADVISAAFEELREQTNCSEQKLKMKRECIFEKGIWTAKKRYILNVWSKENVFYDEPELKVQGIEIVKSSTPRAAKKTMKEAIKLIVNTDEQTFQNYIASLRAQFRALPFEEIAFPRGVKHLEKYASRSTIYQDRCPIHVRGALVYNHMIRNHESKGDTLQAIVNGDKIKFSYMIMPNPLLENVIAVPGDLPSELGLDHYIDRDMQFEKGVLAPLKVITDAIGWHLEPVASLEDLLIYD